MGQQKLLQSGAVSASSRRKTTFSLVVATWGIRIWTDLASGRDVPEAPTSLAEFLRSPEWPWVDPPLPTLILALGELVPAHGFALLALELAAAAIVVVSLMRLGERWLDFDAAIIGAGLWAVCAPALAIFRVPGSEGWQAALAVMVAGSMLFVARRRAPQMAWRIGALSGVLTLFSGGGLLWILGAIAWLPLTSTRFRGWGFARSAALIVAGWLVVVLPFVLRNAVVSGGDPKLPLAGDVARLHAAMHQGGVEAPASFSERGAAVRTPRSVAYTDTVLRSVRLPSGTSEWTRSTNLLTLALHAASEDRAAGWKSIPRRLVAALGGWSPPDREPVHALPWAVVVILAWTGVTALLPGARQLFPLMLGALVPLVQGMALGLSSGTLLAASPFVCLYAGYGIWRIWTGRRSVVTWMLAPLTLLLAILLHWAVRSWS